MEETYRVAIYNRCSSDEQEGALKVQVEQSLDIARKKKWKVTAHYIELKSGTSIERRTEYQKMVAEIKKDNCPFDIIMIKSFDRLFRNLIDQMQFIELLVSKGIRLYIYMDDKFYNDVSDRFISGVLGLMNENFSRELARKIKNSHKIRQEKRSGLNFTKAVYGWTKVSKSEYVINEEQAYYYREMFRLIKLGYGFYTIANKLYEMGARSATGKKIDSAVWRNMAMSPKSYGCVIMHKFEVINKKLTKMDKKDWIIWDNALPPIISKAEWEQCMAILKTRKTDDYRTNSGKYPLSRKIKCGLCGASYHRFMYTDRKGIKRSYWKCASAYRNGRNNPCGCSAESLAEDKLMKILENACERYYESLYESNESIIEKTVFMIQSVLSENGNADRIKKLKSELFRLDNKKNNLLNKLADGVIEDDDFIKINASINSDIERATNELRLLEAKVESLSENEKRLLEIRKELSDTDIIERAKNNSILQLIKSITVLDNANLRIEFDRFKILDIENSEMLGLTDDDYTITVHYDGFSSLKERTSREKEEILALVRENPDLSFGQIAKRLGITKNNVTARIRILKKENRLYRNENGKFVVTA